MIITKYMSFFTNDMPIRSAHDTSYKYKIEIHELVDYMYDNIGLNSSGTWG